MYVFLYMFILNSDVYNYIGFSGNLIENCIMIDK